MASQSRTPEQPVPAPVSDGSVYGPVDTVHVPYELVLGLGVGAMLLLVLGCAALWVCSNLPRIGRGPVVLNRLVALGALGILGANQLVFIALSHEGIQKTCDRAASDAGIRARTDAEQISAEQTWSFFPPTLHCRFFPDGQGPGIVANLNPQGPWIIWGCLLVLTLTVLCARALRRRRQNLTRGKAAVPPLI